MTVNDTSRITAAPDDGDDLDRVEAVLADRGVSLVAVALGAWVAKGLSA